LNVTTIEKLPLDDLNYCILHSLSRSARISATDLNSRRSNVRILVDRQLADGKNARHHYNQRQHPCKNGAIDEKT